MAVKQKPSSEHFMPKTEENPSTYQLKRKMGTMPMELSEAICIFIIFRLINEGKCNCDYKEFM